MPQISHFPDAFPFLDTNAASCAIHGTAHCQLRSALPGGNRAPAMIKRTHTSAGRIRERGLWKYDVFAVVAANFNVLIMRMIPQLVQYDAAMS